MTTSNLALKANCKIPVFIDGSFVKRMAAIMIPIKGMTAFFTLRFSKIRKPQVISKKAVTYNIISGKGSPKLIKTSARCELNTFITPEVINTYATT